MQYKSYDNKKSAPQRMSRKRNRSTIFVYNKKLKKVERRKRLLANRERNVGDSDSINQSE